MPNKADPSSATLDTLDIIRRKRDGHALTEAEITHIARGAADDSIDDAQLSAFLMATFLRGMEPAEVQSLAHAMRTSGVQLDLRRPANGGPPRPTVDKHSTGGVGDKTSFLVAPIAAAAGLHVPMVCGRALGHAGGTLDKLETIPGFRSTLTPGEMQTIIDHAGCSMVGQSADLVPADRRLYALRDHIGTVESPYMICASIMGKKLAEGLDALVLDVKTGSGAYLPDHAVSRFLARLMVETGETAGTRTAALLTDMSQPLGRFAGNSVEVIESLSLLRGERHRDNDDLRELSLILAGWMLFLTGVGNTAQEGRARAEGLLVDGSALRRFEQMVALQGGDLSALAHKPAQQRVLRASRSGFLFSMDTAAIGWAVQRLGAGRPRPDLPVSAHAGIELHAKTGAQIRAGDPLCTLFADDAHRFSVPERMIAEAILIADAPPRPTPLVHEVLTRDTLTQSSTQPSHQTPSVQD
jgi:pyrimidine-nucleoside phosphorylase